MICSALYTMSKYAYYKYLRIKIYNLRKSIQCMVNSDHFYSTPLFEDDKLLCELRLAPKMSCIRLYSNIIILVANFILAITPTTYFILAIMPIAPIIGARRDRTCMN